MSKIGESRKIIFSIKVSKNYFSQVYGQKLGQKCDLWGEFGQNRSFLLEMVKIWSFWGPILRHMSKFWVGRKYFFLETVSKVILFRV